MKDRSSKLGKRFVLVVSGIVLAMVLCVWLFIWALTSAFDSLDEQRQAERKYHDGDIVELVLGDTRAMVTGVDFFGNYIVRVLTTGPDGQTGVDSQTVKEFEIKRKIR
tara:strand:+ start:1847 stop:2170 length:324 start_codon:yes stop_codon:yes gene_type:complete